MSFAYAIDPIANQNVDLNETVYVESMPSSSTCTFQCPTMKSGYFSRIKDVVPINGETQCYVYANGSPSEIIGYVSVKNDKCVSEYNVKDAQNAVDYTKKTDEYYQNFENIRKQYQDHYTNTGTRKFLRASEYLIAGLTADSEIVNIDDTITKNRLVLNSNYTIYPNLTTSAPDKTMIQEVANTLGGIYGAVMSYFANEPEKVVENSMSSADKAKELISLSENLFSSIIAFVLNWLAESNQLIMELNSSAFFMILPLTGVLYGSSKLTKIFSKVSDNDDVYEKFLVMVGIVAIFYVNNLEIETKDDKKISQTNFQVWSRPVLYQGVWFADRLTDSFATAYLKYKMKDAGILFESDYAKVKDEVARLEKEQNLIVGTNQYLEHCYKVYDTETLKNTVSPLIGLGTVFPPLGALTKHRKSIVNGGFDINQGVSNLDETSFIRQEYRRSQNVPTLDFCYNLERRYLENKKVLESNKAILTRYDDAKAQSKDKKAIELIAKLHYKNTAEMGFINASSIASTQVLVDNLHLFQNVSDVKLQTEKTIKAEQIANAKVYGTEIDGVAIGSDPTLLSPSPINLDIIYDGLHWISYNGAYMIIPPSSTIKNDIVQPFLQTIVDATIGKAKNMLKGAITAITGGTGGFVAQMVDSLTSNKENGVIMSTIIAVLSTVITIGIMKYFISYIPLVAISVGSYMAIAFYYLSVEIFYLVAPFMAIYALTANQFEVVKNFVIRFLGLAFKPVLIVVSIVLAVIAYELLDSIGKYIAHKTFDTFFTITAFDRNTINYSSYANASGLYDYAKTTIENTTSIASSVVGGILDFNDYGLNFFKGLLVVSIDVVKVLVSFYLVFYGATMILNIFGIKESGIDAQDTVGANVEGKSSRYNAPI
jgi:hypothetical protein